MLQNTSYAKRSAKDFVTGRQMELCRGFRFEGDAVAGLL